MPSVQSYLFVVHGPGRGRSVQTGQAFLDRMRDKATGFRPQIDIHRTGDPIPDLDRYQAIVFWLGDPLRENHPECFTQATVIHKRAERSGIAVLNSPHSLSNTSKVRQSRIWELANIPSARGWAVETKQQVIDLLGTVQRPLLLRQDGHSRRDVAILKTPDQAASSDLSSNLPGLILEMHDLRAAHQGENAPLGELYARFHHKARAFVFRDEVFSSHLFFSKKPIVCAGSCLFKREDRPRRALARAFGFRKKMLDQLVDIDQNYFDTPVQHKKTLIDAVRALKLDFAAVDYSFKPDGSIILWEANPYFNLPHGRESVMFERRSAIARVNQTFDWMADCLAQMGAQTDLMPTAIKAANDVGLPEIVVGN